MKTRGRTGAKPIVLDTAVFVQTPARRLIAAAQERAGGEVLIVDEVAGEIGRAYARVSRGSIWRQVQWEEDRREAAHGNRSLEGEALEEYVARRLAAKTRGFVEWAEGEGRRNAGIYRRVGASPRAEGLAVRIGGSVGEEYEEALAHGGASGDPLVLAQALEAGAELVTTHNMEWVLGGELDKLVARERERGRWTNASTPFVVSPDRAVERRLGSTSETGRDAEICALAHAAVRPADVEARSSEALEHGLLRYAGVLRRCGLRASSAAIRREVHRNRRRLKEWFAELERSAIEIPKTRTAESARLHKERMEERRVGQDRRGSGARSEQEGGCG